MLSLFQKEIFEDFEDKLEHLSEWRQIEMKGATLEQTLPKSLNYRLTTHHLKNQGFFPYLFPRGDGIEPMVVKKSGKSLFKQEHHKI